MNAQNDNTVNQDELVSSTNMEAPGITDFLSDSSIYLDRADIIGLAWFQQGIKTKKEKTTI